MLGRLAEQTTYAPTLTVFTNIRFCSQLAQTHNPSTCNLEHSQLSEEWALKTNGSHRHRSIPVEDDVDVLPAVGLAVMHHAIVALSMPLFSMALTLG